MPVDDRTLRKQFPVLEHTAYLNAGTDGPLPAVAAQAGAKELAGEAERGRARAHFERRTELGSALRVCYARALGCESGDVALTTCTTEGLSIVIDGLDLKEGDEILTSEEEHPGLLGVLAAAREANGAVVRMAPFDLLADEVGPSTRLVACSHVSWMTGRLAPAGLSELDIPVVLDGAQGVGAIHTDVHALGCDAYAGAGQKWMCGPDGTGMLYVSPELRERVRSKRRGYGNLHDPEAGLQARLQEDARRFDTLALSAEALATALAAAEVLEGASWTEVHERALALSSSLVGRLESIGREVTPRGDTTLVSFSSPDPEGERTALAQDGVVLRDIPGKPWLRASVGAWNDERDLERLLATLAR
ncbi:MAG TPA: aminotransferase class V-fold PLP-dependent enzyme [Solirubrobacteraceae bacterium]|jgi:L-cysteine/cystine lyase